MNYSSPCIQSLFKLGKFTPEPVQADGNCFYRAVAKGYYKDVDMHHMLRRTTIEHMMETAAEYVPYFESQKSLMDKLNANKRLGVWNTDLADMVPQVVAALIGCCIHIYAVTENDTIMKYTFGEGPVIHLLLHNNHYNLLVKQ